MTKLFTEWSARLFDELSTKNKLATIDRDLVVKNKLLGFQKFDFNVMQQPYKLTFSGKTLQKESRAYASLFISSFYLPISSRNFGSNTVLAKVTANKLVNTEPTNEIYSIDLSFAAGALSFEAGDNAIVTPSNPVSTSSIPYVKYFD